MIADFVLIKDKLNGEYKTTYNEIYKWATLHNVDDQIGNEQMMDFLDLFVTYQNEGKDIKELVGKNLDIFCRNYFEIYDTKDFLRNLIHRYAAYSLTLGIIEVFAFDSDVPGYVFLFGYIGGILVDFIYSIIVYKANIKVPNIIHTSMPMLFTVIALYALSVADLNVFISRTFAIMVVVVVGLTLLGMHLYLRKMTIGAFFASPMDYDSEEGKK